MTTATNLDDFDRRLVTIRRHLHGLIVAVDALEQEIHARQAQRPDDEDAARRAREVVYRAGPSEIKIMHD